MLTCGQEESEGQLVLTCNLEEGEVTTTISDTPVCGLEEHTHTLACCSDPAADVETAQIWERAIKNVELTGDWREDVIAIAKTQLGYQESAKNYIVLEVGETIKGYTRYGAWYGDPYGDWCAMFASFVLNYAEVEGIPLDAWTPTVSIGSRPSPRRRTTSTARRTSTCLSPATWSSSTLTLRTRRPLPITWVWWWRS